MRKILIATRNTNKIPEIMAELQNTIFEIVGLDSVDNLPKDYEIDENATTFEGNAVVKAMTYGNKTGLLTLADDSGLCVDVLNGRPGVLSSRYAEGTGVDRYTKLLNEIKGIPAEKRTARYVSVVAIYDPKTETVHTFEGTSEGLITSEPIGENGFGYDPVFFSPEFKKTYAQITPEERNSISHRGKAMSKVREFLMKLDK